eukprot:gene13452-19883_t
MGRHCRDCEEWCDYGDFSNNQWRKGEGSSRCQDCVAGSQQTNELTMHMQTHRPRNTACPVCGEIRFASAANAVAHVESGSCSGCRGTRNQAASHIYRFAQQHAPGTLHRSQMMLENGGSESMPDEPYGCRQCGRTFRQLSSMMQHSQDAHGSGLQQIGWTTLPVPVDVSLMKTTWPWAARAWPAPA